MHTKQNEHLAPASLSNANATPQTALEQLSALTQISNEPNFNRKLELIVNGLNQIGWNRVALTLRDHDFYPTKLITAGLTENEISYLRDNSLPPTRWLELFQDPTFHAFREGSIYFLPGDSRFSQRIFGSILPDTQASAQENPAAWHPNDLLTVVLLDRQQQRIGLINLDQPVDGLRPSAEMRQTIELYSQFAAATLENAMLVQETIGRANELEHLLDDIVDRERFYSALGSMSLAIHYTLDVDSVMNLICREGRSIFNVDGAYMWQASATGIVCCAAEGDASDAYLALQLQPTEPTIQTLMQHHDAFFINQYQQAGSRPRSLPNADQIQSMLGVPLEQDGHQIGYLFLVENSNPNRFTDRDLTWATMFGVQAAVALRNAQLFAELRSFNTELDRRVAERTQALSEESSRVKVLLRITSELSSSLDQGRVLNQALELVNESIKATQGVIMLIDPETNQLVFRAALGSGEIPPDGRPSRLRRNEGLAGWVIQHSESVIVQDTLTDKRWLQLESNQEVRSVLAVPLIAGEEIIGVLMLFHTEPNTFTRQQVALVEAAATQVANATSNANLYVLIRDQAERLGKMLRLEQIESAKNQAILESIADGVLVADENNQISLANRPASTILGLTHGALIGKPINELLGLYGQSERPWLKIIDSWRNGNPNNEWTFLADKLTIENKVVSIHLSPVISGQQFFGTVSIFRDVTKEVEVDRLKSEFVSNVSHELRTPMTSIKGYVDLLLLGAGGEVSSTQRNYLEVVKNNAQRLQLLVNDLLDISRLESGQTKLEKRPFSIEKLINSLVYGYATDRIQREQSTISLTSSLSNVLPLVYADEERITQVLTNLLDNAMNYTPSGGDITVKAETIDNYVQISVQDTGIGIAPQNLMRIFDRFFRADAADVQKVPGTGLGLAIVYSLVTMHGGEMSVDSTLGEGSTFKFTLPVASPAKLKALSTQTNGDSR